MIHIKQGYVIAYERTDNTIGFLGTDIQSDYPYFTDRPDYKNIKKTPDILLSALEYFNSDMKTFYDHAKVKFDTGRIVKFSYTIEDVDMSAENIAYEKAVSKLSGEDLQAIINHHKQK